MIRRILNPSKKQSFFLFGPRGCGKTTLIRDLLKEESHLWIDLLNLENELRYKNNPELLYQEYQALKNKPQWIVIDEIQKVSGILDVAHRLIEENKVKFALTGSSARKLKRSHANLLGGRAFSFSLSSFSYQELENHFDLPNALNFGTLPKIYDPDLSDNEDKKRYLKSYVNNYIKEEIIVEQIVRNIEPFNRFLEVAAQSNGEIINYSKMAREAKVTDKSVARYFDILSDTLMGHLLPAYHKSVRQQQIGSPKFYFFDVGVVRAIRGDLKYSASPQTYDYGKLFESFIISEIIKLNNYYETDFKLSYLKTKDGAEIDLIISDNKKTFLVEIKSSKCENKTDVRSLYQLFPSFKNAQALVLCLNDHAIELDKNIYALNWREGIERIFE